MENIIELFVSGGLLICLYYWIKKNIKPLPKQDQYVLNIHKFGCMNLEYYLDEEEMIDNVIYLHENNKFFQCENCNHFLSVDVIKNIQNSKEVLFKNEFENITIKIKKI